MEEKLESEPLAGHKSPENGNDPGEITLAKAEPSIASHLRLDAEGLASIDRIADKLLADAMADKNPVPAPPQKPTGSSKTYKHPMVVDLLLALGLLFAMGGLTVSFVKAYTTHSAHLSIVQGNYKAAISILRGSPIPELFGSASNENSEDLLNQALYLDSMEKLDANRDDQTALQELAKITASSRFYDLAQDQLRQLSSKRNPQLPVVSPSLQLPPQVPQPQLPTVIKMAPAPTQAPTQAPAQLPIQAPTKKEIGTGSNSSGINDSNKTGSNKSGANTGSSGNNANSNNATSNNANINNANSINANGSNSRDAKSPGSGNKAGRQANMSLKTDAH